MTPKRKIITWVLMAILALPALMIFNESDNININLIGFAYACVAFLTVPRVIPSWMLAYLKDQHKN